ncbi:MAG TPA: PHB depolymerase family esterase, partial [Phototrophicaceae bacterium]|nr:PHB depolymerase family esterase [Phototrophicaceae bacterium]
NDGLGLTFLTTVKENTDDVGFIAALLDHMIQTYTVDTNRVYVTGFSSGANLSYLLACQLSDRFAAVAVVGSLMMEKVAEDCQPTEPISLLMIQGTADPVFAWDGGQFVIDRVDYGYQYSGAETLNFWLDHNECASSRQMNALPDLAQDDNTRVWHELYNQCSAETVVELYAMMDGGHNWSGVPSDLSSDLTVNVSYDIAATETIWHFFATHHR